jgi:hypothetical protein
VFSHIFRKKNPEDPEKEQPPKDKSKPATEPKPVTKPKQVAGPKPARERKVPTVMVPLFSRRSIIALAIGCIVGIGLGLGFWIISPSLGSSNTGTEEPAQSGSGMLESLFPSAVGEWSSMTTIEVVNPGSAPIAMSQLQNMARYYSSKANSSPFFVYLSKELAEQAPLYAHTPDELIQMITIKYDIRTDQTTITISAKADTLEETAFLADNVPQIFLNYLEAEEDAKQQQDYENIQQSITDVKASLLVAKEELSSLVSEGAASDIENDPGYIALDAKIRALKTQLEAQAAQLSDAIVSGDVTSGGIHDNEYAVTLQEARNVSVKLTDAEAALHDLEEKRVAQDIQNDPTYITLEAKIDALQAELDRLMTGYTEIVEDNQTHVLGLVEMISSDVTTSQLYKDTLKKVQTTSAALSEAKMQLALLESQAISSNESNDVDYKLTKMKVESLRTQLTKLTDKLALLDSQEISGETQEDIQVTFDRTANALADARKQMDILKSQAGETTFVNLEYTLAQSRVKSLEAELNSLNENLSSSLADEGNSPRVSEYLSVGKSALTIPVPPERMRGRNALLLGAIIGICGAWLVLNYRWLIRALSGNPVSAEGEKKHSEDDDV